MSERSLTRIRSASLVFLVFIFLLICVFLLSGIWQGGSRYPMYRLNAPSRVNVRTEQASGDGPLSLSLQYAKEKGDFREQFYLLPEERIPAPTLRLYGADVILDITLDGQELFSYGTTELERLSFAPGGFHLLVLPEDCAGKELGIRYTATRQDAALLASAPLYANYQDAISFWVSETRIVVYIGIFLTLFGFLLSALWFLMRRALSEDLQMLFGGVIAFYMGIYTLCRHHALFFFTSSCTLRTYLEVITQMLLPVLISFFLRLLAHDRMEQHLFFLSGVLSAAVAGLVLLLQFLRLVPLTSAMQDYRAYFAGINVVLFVAGVRIFRRWFLQFQRLRSSALQDAQRTGHTGNLLLLAGILFLTLTLLADELLNFFDRNPADNNMLVHRILLAGTLLFTLLLLLRYFYHSVNDFLLTAGNERLSQLAYTDALTKLPNRAYCEIALDALFKEERPFAVVSMDINDLKKTNDIKGHAAGDELLKNFADILRASFRSTDICGRMSGDEFIAILFDVTPQEYGEKVRQVLTELPISVSFGAAHSDEVHTRDAHAVYKLADERMYKMKQQVHGGEAVYAAN